MTETELEQVLDWVREQVYPPQTEDPEIPQGCFSFDRARELILDERRWTAAEREHRAGCGRCDRFMELFAAEMPHLPLGWLVRSLFSLSSPSEQLALRYHLVEGGCTQCADRLRQLERVKPSTAWFGTPFSLRRPGAARASVGELHLEQVSEDGRLEVELFQEDGQATLELRSKDAGLNHQLVGYWLTGTNVERGVAGYVVLHPDVDGWYTGQVRFDSAALYATLGGECRAAVLQPVDRAVLTRQEQDQLLESVQRDRQDAAAQRAWQAWAGQEDAGLREETRQMLTEIRESLR